MQLDNRKQTFKNIFIFLESLFIIFLSSFTTNALSQSVLINDNFVPGTLEIGDMATYVFKANADEAVQIRIANTSGKNFTPIAWLYNPDGTLNRSDYSSTMVSFHCYKGGGCSLKQTGTYKLLIADRNSDNPGMFKVGFTYVPSSNKNGPVRNENRITKEVTLGEIDSYFFNANTGDSVQIRITKSTGENFTPIAWLYNPDGTLNHSDYSSTTVSFHCYKGGGCSLNQTGTYKLLIADRDSDDTGSYKLGFINLSGDRSVSSLDNNSPINKPDHTPAGSNDLPSKSNNQEQATSNIVRAYNAYLKNPEHAPEYLYRTESIHDNISTAWMTLTDGIRGQGDKKAIYDQFYSASLDYLNLKDTSLISAKREIEKGNTELANRLYSDFLRYESQYNNAAKAAIDIYNGDLDSAITLAERIYKGSRAFAIYGSRMLLSPAGASAVDKLFTATNFYINQSEAGTASAVNQLVTSQIVGTLLNKVPIKSLGGKTINSAIENSTTTFIGQSQLYSMLGEAIDSEKAKEVIMKFLADSSAVVASEGVEYAAEEYIKLTQHLKQQLELN